MNLPLVSILMAVFDNASAARVAIQSILNQTLTDFEFIIVDDGSDDETKLLLEAYAAIDDRIVLVHNESNLGLTQSLNKGLTLAKGTYIARQDADDISMPQRLENQIAFLQNHSGVGLLGTAFTVINDEGTSIAAYQQPYTDTGIRWQMLFHNAFCHTSVVCQHALLRSHRLKYDEGKPLSQDYDLWGKMLLHTKGANLPEALVCVRKHEKSVSILRHDSQQDLANRIADDHMRQVWLQHPFTLIEIEILRRWYNRFPKLLTEQDMILCKSFLHLIAVFGQQPNVDSIIVNQITALWTYRILNVVYRVNQWACLLSSGLFGALIRYGLPRALTFTPYWLSRRIRRRLRNPARIETKN